MNWNWKLATDNMLLLVHITREVHYLGTQSLVHNTMLASWACTINVACISWKALFSLVKCYSWHAKFDNLTLETLRSQASTTHSALALLFAVKKLPSMYSRLIYDISYYWYSWMRMSRKDGSPEMIGPPGPLDSEIFGPPLREPVPHATMHR